MMVAWSLAQSARTLGQSFVHLPNTPGVPGPFRDMFPACLADEIFLPTLDPALYVQCVFPSHQWGKWMLSSDHEASFSVERP